ncbi:MAG: TRAP transporter small permease subunit [Hyphomicrobiales bacterium]
MSALLQLSRWIDHLSRWMGLLANWMVLGATLACALDAGLRYGLGALLSLSGGHGPLAEVFDLYRNNSNALRDLQLIFFAGMVLLGASWTLKLNEHVRVDLFYHWVSDRTRTWIDLFGGLLFLVPFCIIMLHFSWPWFLEAWRNDEMSQNAGGLARWPLKAFVPLGFSLILLQGLSEIIKCVASLSTGYRREHAYEKPLQ